MHILKFIKSYKWFRFIIISPDVLFILQTTLSTKRFHVCRPLFITLQLHCNRWSLLEYRNRNRIMWYVNWAIRLCIVISSLNHINDLFSYKYVMFNLQKQTISKIILIFSQDVVQLILIVLYQKSAWTLEMIPQNVVCKFKKCLCKFLNITKW